MKTELITESQDSLTQDQFLKHILHIEPKDVNLKFIFDHIRNYGICGAMLWAAVKVLTEAGSEPGILERTLTLAAGALLFALPWILFAANFAHGLVAAGKLQKTNRVNIVLYSVLCLVVFAAAGKLMLLARV
ncbi:hypothetical protein [Caldimonas sp. KR1-144]|uniref:hypothetical protein n=1 Tax=Caldimonas sp. KR1-144 TaxID=3400911 RepID=UPI003C0294A9